VSLGPKFLCGVLDTEQYEERMWLVQRTASASLTGYPLLGLSDLYKYPYRVVSPADKYERRDGDLEGYLSTLPPLERPTTLWKLRWFGLRPINQLLPSRMHEVGMNMEECMAILEPGPVEIRVCHLG
jgi:hypothetical protein